MHILVTPTTFETFHSKFISDLWNDGFVHDCTIVE